ncbi:GTP cyclohydrolase FolE2 [Occallatibacter savannae]|uniref:GTP cyclohydrolase FolE2 n=1 Tax=Occallatibacter savannae TaxID=1002691 RepID=UPI000D68BBF7|nr:GTP cyclohydrolase FolE2 [Occallatibacter savannae]
MHDVQNHSDERGIPIDRVGVCGLKYPIIVLNRDGQRQPTIATISMSVDLSHRFKGTHMSRFIEVLNRYHGEIAMRTFPLILDELKSRLQAKKAHIEMKFPYFLQRSAPVSGAKAMIDYECRFSAECNASRDDFFLSVSAPVTTLCPCSKAISDYGAHNQRGEITIDVMIETGGRTVWIEEIIEIAEASASSPVYGLLKRADERHVTMQAYDNPTFVEDIVRNVTVRLKGDERIMWFKVHAINHESIHNHNAFAEIHWQRQQLATLARKGDV